MRTLSLSIPTGDPRQPMRYVIKLDVERRGIKQVESTTREHALPRTRGGSR
jgi:hypothetical protein